MLFGGCHIDQQRKPAKCVERCRWQKKWIETVSGPAKRCTVPMLFIYFIYLSMYNVCRPYSSLRLAWATQSWRMLTSTFCLTCLTITNASTIAVLSLLSVSLLTWSFAADSLHHSNTMVSIHRVVDAGLSYNSLTHGDEKRTCTHQVGLYRVFRKKQGLVIFCITS